MAKIKTTFFCTACGHEVTKWMGRCPGCGEWNTLEEGLKPSKKEIRHQGYVTSTTRMTKSQTFAEIQMDHVQRMKISMEEVNNVLGGGFVQGSMVLITGEPGIGKSTLLLQLSQDIAIQDLKVLYISGEESAQQIKSRAERLNTLSSNIKLFTETDLSLLQQEVEREKPNLIIVDSIQTVYRPEIDSAAGSQTQIKESTATLLKLAKTYNICFVIVAHVTKCGELAGPRALEHMVDTVLYFEGDRHGLSRLLYAVKNRFGATGEVGLLNMGESGLEEVTNPSELFLEERTAGTIGSAIMATMEGTRALLVEVQALLTPTNFGNPRRMGTGLNTNRLNLCCAILEKYAKLMLQQQDAYIKVIGGLKIEEPAADLSLAMAIASSYKAIPIPAGDILIGELGLTGEVRRVARIEERVKEAKKLGFTRAIIPERNLKGSKFPKGIEVIGVKTIDEAIRKCLVQDKMPF